MLTQNVVNGVKKKTLKNLMGVKIGCVVIQIIAQVMMVVEVKNLENQKEKEVEIEEEVNLEKDSKN